MAKSTGRVYRWGNDDSDYGTELQEPRDAIRTPPTGADLVATDDPAYSQICRAAMELLEFGYDPADLDVAARAIAVGRARYARNPTPCPGDDVTESSEPKDPFAHAPGEVVYYMRIGNRVKIGVSRNLPLRMAAINPEELMVTEPGNRLLEKVRHQQFAPTRTHGEWFRLDERLAAHIAELQALAEQEQRDTA